MIGRNTSQLSVFFQSITIVVWACLVLKFIDGQGDEWPEIVDPFPDIIGPEPVPTPPPPPDCTYACEERVNEADRRITTVENQLRDANFSLSNRITNLERNSGGGGGNTAELAQRVSTLERILSANITSLMMKINSDINLLRTQLTDDIASLRRDLEARINAIPVGGGGNDGGKAMEVYFNLTNKIRLLEDGKIQSLINDNNLWRSNFRVVNATFSKLRKSNSGNNVILTG